MIKVSIINITNVKSITTNISKIVYQNSNRSLIQDSVISEQPLQVRLYWRDNNVAYNKVIAITMRTPGDDQQLIIGLLISEGVIASVDNIAQIQLENTDNQANERENNNDYASQTNEQDNQLENQWEVILTENVLPNIVNLERYQVSYSSCGLCGSTSLKSLELKNPPVIDETPNWLKAEIIYSLPNLLKVNQPLFKQSGGAHAAALFSENGELIFIKEDIGRHNALDKLIGTICQQANFSMNNTVLVISSRVSFEIIQKAVMIGVPVLIAIGAPTDLAISAAKRFNLTLIGFASTTSFNLYTGQWRIASLAEES